MGILKEKEKRCIAKTINTLQEIDVYNVVHEDALLLEEWRLVKTICDEFDVGEKLAIEWLNKAKRMNYDSHNAMLQQETNVRKARDEKFAFEDLIDKPINSTSEQKSERG